MVWISRPDHLLLPPKSAILTSVKTNFFCTPKGLSREHLLISPKSAQWRLQEEDGPALSRCSSFDRLPHVSLTASNILQLSAQN